MLCEFGMNSVPFSRSCTSPPTTKSYSARYSIRQRNRPEASHLRHPQAWKRMRRYQKYFLLENAGPVVARSSQQCWCIALAGPLSC